MRAFLLSLGLLAIAACDDAVFVDPCVENPASCEPPGPEIIGGVNVSALLQPASVEDLDRARQVWVAGAPRGYSGALAAEADGPNGERFYLLEIRDSGRDTLVTYALARRPNLTSLPPSLPVLLIVPEDPAVSTGDFLLQAADEPLRSGWIQVIAVPRGGSITFDGITRQAPGPPSPYLYDVADAIGTLTATRNIVPRARGRSAAVGFGPGGSAALLASARDPSIQAVGSLAAPSDLFLGGVPDAIRAVLDGRPASGVVPGFPSIAADVIVPLREGTITPEQARAALFARSPVYFTGAYAPAAVYHGSQDGIIPVAHGRRLDGAMRAEPTLVASYIETEDVHESLFENFGVRSDLATHLDQNSR